LNSKKEKDDVKEKEEEKVPPQTGFKSRPISSKIMRMRESNARLLGLSDEQLQAEKENASDPIQESE